jgi:glycosyltransferase involved in cell wall biosynthesis
MGGGTRLKVLEAMAMGKAIVSTSFGFEGIGAVPDLHLVVADEPSEFARRAIELWGDEERRQKLGQAARTLAERYDWRDIAPLLERVYEEAV